LRKPDAWKYSLTVGSNMTADYLTFSRMDIPRNAASMAPLYLQDNEADLTQQLERCKVLLKATYDILKKCDEGCEIKDVFAQIAHWDGADCDGGCLMEDIKNYLELEDEN
jgi:hypothetical protein